MVPVIWWWAPETAITGSLVDFSDEAQLSATIERELEEELFGRPEVDSTLGEQCLADPMHEGSLSAPMRWLMEHADQETWRIECVGLVLIQ